MFVLLNTAEMPDLRLGNVALSREAYEHTTSLFDITFFIRETANGLQGSVQYCTDLYSSETIIRMTEHFKELLTSIVNAPIKE
jgi:non-ribosomal peptide synthetase component F